MNYGHIRVTTDKQTVENHRYEITKWYDSRKIIINGWIQEKISGTKNYTKRALANKPQLRQMEKRNLSIKKTF